MPGRSVNAIREGPAREPPQVNAVPTARDKTSIVDTTRLIAIVSDPVIRNAQREVNVFHPVVQRMELE